MRFKLIPALAMMGKSKAEEKSVMPDATAGTKDLNTSWAPNADVLISDGLKSFIETTDGAIREHTVSWPYK